MKIINDQNIAAETHEVFSPISINSTQVVMDLKTKTLVQFAMEKFTDVKISL